MLSIIHCNVVIVNKTMCGKDSTRKMAIPPSNDPSNAEGIPCDECWRTYKTIIKYE